MKEQVDRKNILWMIIFRGLIVTLLLLLALIIEYSASFSFSFIPFIEIILAAYLLSAAYFLFYFWGRFLAVQGYVQVLGDLLLITALVYATGDRLAKFTLVKFRHSPGPYLQKSSLDPSLPVRS